jgi:hypothetical protein
MDEVWTQKCIPIFTYAHQCSGGGAGGKDIFHLLKKIKPKLRLNVIDPWKSITYYIEQKQTREGVDILFFLFLRPQLNLGSF